VQPAFGTAAKSLQVGFSVDAGIRAAALAEPRGKCRSRRSPHRVLIAIGSPPLLTGSAAHAAREPERQMKVLEIPLAGFHNELGRPMHLSFVGVANSTANRPRDHLDDHRRGAFARICVGGKDFDEADRQRTQNPAGAQERIGEAGNVILWHEDPMPIRGRCAGMFARHVCQLSHK
jgi:hypothetical protein